MTSCPEARGWDFWWFLKKAWVEIWLWAGPVQLGGDCGRCRNSQHSKNCVSLSSCRKTKTQEGNERFVPEQRESSVFRVFPCIWLYYISNGLLMSNQLLINFIFFRIVPLKNDIVIETLIHPGTARMMHVVRKRHGKSSTEITLVWFSMICCKFSTVPKWQSWRKILILD